MFGGLCPAGSVVLQELVEFAGVFEEEDGGGEADMVAAEGEVVVGGFADDVFDAAVGEAPRGHADKGFREVGERCVARAEDAEHEVIVGRDGITRVEVSKLFIDLIAKEEGGVWRHPAPAEEIFVVGAGFPASQNGAVGTEILEIAVDAFCIGERKPVCDML